MGLFILKLNSLYSYSLISNNIIELLDVVALLNIFYFLTYLITHLCVIYKSTVKKIFTSLYYYSIYFFSVVIEPPIPEGSTTPVTPTPTPNSNTTTTTTTSTTTTTTLKPTTTTTTPKPTTTTTTPKPTTTTQPTTASTTTTTPKPNVTTTTPPPPHKNERKFDGPSFVGGKYFF